MESKFARVPFTHPPPLPTGDDYKDMPTMITYPEEPDEESTTVWKTKTTKNRPLLNAFVEGVVQTTAARRDGGDPVSPGNSWREGNDPVSPGFRAASIQESNMFAALMPHEETNEADYARASEEELPRTCLAPR